MAINFLNDINVSGEVEGTSLDINGVADIAGQTDIHGTLRLHNGQLHVEDTDSDNLHIRMESNGTEGTLRLMNGSNWGLNARGIVNTPRLGA